MDRSPEIGELVSALAKAQLEFSPALKENEGKVQGTSKTGNAYEYAYKYADLASCLSAVRPALNKHAIAFLQFPEVDLEAQTVRVTTSIHHGEQWISQSFQAPATGRQGFNVQSIGAATTYLRRYGLQALCGLASEDDDGNSVATENAPIPKKEKAKGPSPEELEEWRKLFAECQTLEEWNEQVVPLMKEFPRDFVILAAEQAKLRGYKVDRVSGKYMAGAK